MNLLYEFFNDFWEMTLGMAPYLLFGFFIAGLLHSFLPSSLYQKHLGKPTFGSVMKAVLFGIPLPLCSCGVIPTAMSLRKEGASRGSTVAFLTATPQTGVDSIAATYSMMGLPFAVVRPVAALCTSLLGGVLVNKFDHSEEKYMDEDVNTSCKMRKNSKKSNFVTKLWGAVKYGFYDMVEDLGRWLFIGLIVAALITVFVPDDFFTTYASSPLLSMLIVLAISIPMYVCATGSIPIAVALMMKGLSPGAGLVFLMAGPATNFAAILVIYKVLGKRSTILYLASIMIGAISFGLAIDYLLPHDWFMVTHTCDACHEMGLGYIINLASAIFLLVMMVITLIARYTKNDTVTTKTDNMKTYKVGGMMCNHCKNNVEKAIRAIEGVENVIVDLAAGTAQVEGNVEEKTVLDTINSLGYECTVA